MAHNNNSEETKDQITEKYKIWEVAAAKWFKPVYPSQSGGGVAKTKTREILFSQSGEMYLHEDDSAQPGSKTLTFINQTKFIPCLYTGRKDREGVKVYNGDKVYMINHDSSEHFTGIVSLEDSWIVTDDDGDTWELHEEYITGVMGNLCETPKKSDSNA